MDKNHKRNLMESSVKRNKEMAMATYLDLRDRFERMGEKRAMEKLDILFLSLCQSVALMREIGREDKNASA